MTTDSNLNDIREKIYKLRTAIMYSMSNGICKLPNSIVTALKVSDEGELWFICEKPFQDVAEYEQSFPVTLHFYKKGIFFHLEVSGKAAIINEDYSGYLSNEISTKGKVLLIRMSMNSIEYTEPYGKKERNRFETFIEKGYKWALRNIALPHQSKPELSKNTL
jgi:hypothetical protein